MKIIITGVAGLIGSRLADYIIQYHPEVDVIGIDNLSGGFKENINPKVQFFQADLNNPSLKIIFDWAEPDYVFHFAAYAAEGLSPFIRTFNYENNLVATAHIVNECINHNVKRLVYTSSMSVYGHGEGGIFDENMKRSPIDPYGVAKAACEMDIEIAGKQHGLDYCIIRPHNVYGVKQNIWDKYRNVLGIWMYQKLNNKPITIFGDGTQKRAFSFIDDSLEPLWTAMISPEASKQIINLGGIKEYSINEASDIILEVFGDGEKVYLENRYEVHTAVSSYEKSVEILKFRYKTSLKEGLSKMWEWAKCQPQREQYIWKNYEVDKNIYAYWKI